MRNYHRTTRSLLSQWKAYFIHVVNFKLLYRTFLKINSQVKRGNTVKMVWDIVLYECFIRDIHDMISSFKCVPKQNEVVDNI